MAEPTPTSYCSGCANLPVCKYATKITQFDVSMKQFNTENLGTPIRIGITSVSYSCKHRDPI